MRAEDLPELSPLAQPLWVTFRRISGRRQFGMAANPLTFAEIDAFSRLTLTPLTAWQVDLICRMDDAALVAMHEHHRAPQKPREPFNGPIPIDRPDLGKAFFRDIIAAQKAAKTGHQAKPPPPSPNRKGR